MAEITDNKRAPLPLPPRQVGEQLPLRLSGYTWQQYQSIEELFSERGVRVRYLLGELEIMAPVSEQHEHRKSNLGCLVEAWCLAKEVRFFVRGNTTMLRPDVAGGEPDESYCFGEKKEVSDMVIEVALTSGGLSKRAFYRQFGVPELWIWRNEELLVFCFDGASGDYVASVESKVLVGIDLVVLAECAIMEYTSDAIREFSRRCGL